MNFESDKKPCIKIVLEPSEFYRMRYNTEKRITPLYSDKQMKSENENIAIEDAFPKIEIVDGNGPATLIVSCINSTKPYHLHPHKLIGECCTPHGVAVIKIEDDRFFDLNGVSIEYSKKDQAQANIKLREEANIDPFNAGFDFDAKKVDFNKVRLAFQVILHKPTGDLILDSICSNVIKNKRRKSEFSITQTSNLSSSAIGGTNLIVLFKKLEKNKLVLKGKFYDDYGWEEEVEPKIHYDCAAYFKVPRYKLQDIDKKVTVSFDIYLESNNLKRKHEESDDDIDDDIDGEHSYEFTYTPK